MELPIKMFSDEPYQGYAAGDYYKEMNIPWLLSGPLKQIPRRRIKEILFGPAPVSRKNPQLQFLSDLPRFCKQFFLLENIVLLHCPACCNRAYYVKAHIDIGAHIRKDLFHMLEISTVSP